MLFLVGRDRALGTVWWLRPGESTVTVGRKGTDFIVGGDHSVSRRHATISTSEIADGQFGLFLNGRRSSKNEIIEIHIDDLVTFGGQASTFQLRYVKFAVFPVNMKAATAEAKGDTHVVMPSLVVKSAVVTALVHGLPIAALDWIDQIRALPHAFRVDDPTSDSVTSFVASLRCLPPPRLPNVPDDSPIDLSTVGWGPDARRKHLFDGKAFVFVCSTQFDRYVDLVEGAGGTAISYKGFEQWSSRENDGASTNGEQLVEAAAKEVKNNSAIKGAAGDDCGQQICIVTPLSSGSSRQDGGGAVLLAKALARKLNTCPVSESEIGLAVLFVSCREHVNPQIKEQTKEPAPAAQSADGGQRKRRRGINSFWSSLVSSPADSKSRGDETPAPPAPTSAAMSVTDRVETPPVEPVDKQAHISQPEQADAAAVASNHTNRHGLDGPGLVVKRVRLVKPKPAIGTQQNQQNAGMPNFKRFKKTIHTYQLTS
ncbi:hypothetical protein DL89DRAFT_324529 [Linderina pennispora]|uniref:FHA domain-containing protein n=1 Tax=Linderina pennispora TaxID=61395 RepID=A0A1Y1W1H3_9FUNG|nr:uncharacterized protein DL89DRAFT_324529 [Linderina pennispora]ORX67155.1 hypothetical protein DL89DRAFT_324529 [Linderina pennispora]